MLKQSSRNPGDHDARQTCGLHARSKRNACALTKSITASEHTGTTPGTSFICQAQKHLCRVDERPGRDIRTHGIATT
jgi:hypothetical protein